MTNRITPDEAFDAILATGPRPQKARNLRELHEVCKALYEVGPRDFSISNIGKLCEEKGIFKGRGLYNESAEDYRKLIQAWADLAGPMPPKLVDKEKPSEAYVAEIKDPVLRVLVRRDLAQLARVTAELNLLKSQKTFVVDKRPIVESVQPALGNNALKALEAFELQALKKALAPKSLSRRGWQEGKLGDIVDERGRPIFEPGFATGLRKLLGEL